MGQGYPVVLVHTAFENASIFQNLAHALSKTFQVVLLDLRGHGYSDKPRHIKFNEFADDIILLLDCCGDHDRIECLQVSRFARMSVLFISIENVTYSRKRCSATRRYFSLPTLYKRLEVDAFDGLPDLMHSLQVH
jgi:hypothetical protein